MLKTVMWIYNTLWNNIFSKYCLLLLVLYGLAGLTEGRPKTLRKCGRSESSMGRIVGGKSVQPGDYPWQVSIHVKQNGSYRFTHWCGGAILNEHYIVTAAHCIEHPEKPWMYQIYTGLHQLSKKSDRSVRKYKVSKATVHENYTADEYLYDIALLRTRDPIQFDSVYVNGICLPQNNEDPTGWVVVTGWGHAKSRKIVDNGKNELSDTLQAVKVPLVPRKECFAAYDIGPEDQTFDILDSQICAGIITRDACQHDSGGPLVQKNQRGVYILIGIVSFGFGCAQKTYPGVYTKVAYFMDWLEKNMY